MTKTRAALYEEQQLRGILTRLESVCAEVDVFNAYEARDMVRDLIAARSTLAPSAKDDEIEFLRKRRGELVIERDRYKAALGQYPEGRDVMLGGALAEIESLRARLAPSADDRGLGVATEPDGTYNGHISDDARLLHDLEAKLAQPGDKMWANLSQVGQLLERCRARLAAPVPCCRALAPKSECWCYQQDRASAPVQADYTSPQDYAAKNPLGGVAKCFDIMADRLRAGEAYESVLADFGLCESAPVPAIARDAPREPTQAILERDRQARNAIDPVTRLHNVCDHLAEQRAESPYNAEALELADASNGELQAKLSAAESEARAWHLAALRVQLPHAMTDTSTAEKWEAAQAAAACALFDRVESAESEARRLREALTLLYQTYVVDLHGENICDCDNSVGKDDCAPCTARARLAAQPGEGK